MPCQTLSCHGCRNRRDAGVGVLCKGIARWGGRGSWGRRHIEGDAPYVPSLRQCRSRRGVGEVSPDLELRGLNEFRGFAAELRQIGGPGLFGLKRREARLRRLRLRRGCRCGGRLRMRRLKFRSEFRFKLRRFWRRAIRDQV